MLYTKVSAFIHEVIAKCDKWRADATHIAKNRTNIARLFAKYENATSPVRHHFLSK